jgi:phospholipid/cholesterol/gamma-HCH transport system substrate-binding protein
MVQEVNIFLREGRTRMETRANYTMVGGFVVFFVVAIVAFIMWIANTNFSHKTTQYDIYFSRSVTGLKEGGTVLYRGVPVGAVKRITLDPLNVEKVLVTIALEGAVQIKKDAFASLELQGITGVAYIQLNGGTKDAPQLLPDKGQTRAVIPTRSSVFEEVTASLPAVLHQVSKTFEDIRPIFDQENRKAFGESLKNIHTITQALVAEPGKENNIHELMLSMKEGVKEIRSMVKEINKVLNDNHTNIRTFTGEGLPSLTEFLKEGKETLTTIRRVGEALERSPSRFVYNDPRQGVKVP